MPVVLRNNATTTLASSITALSTSIALKAGTGGKFPAPSAGEWFPVTLVKADNSNEIVRCTARTGDVLTVARAQEGTLAQVFSAGDRVELRVTAAVLAEQKAETTAAQEAADAAQETAQAITGLAVKKDASTTTGAAVIPSGTEAQRPGAPANGMFRYNSEKNQFEGYQNGAWGQVGGGDHVLSVKWEQSRALIAAGAAASDGQLLSRATYPDAWAQAQAAGLVITDSAWLADPTKRGMYSSGNGSTTFRLPDYNGKTAGSLGAVFLRGDGALSAAVAGVIQRDAFQGHHHRAYSRGTPAAAGSNDSRLLDANTNNSDLPLDVVRAAISDGTNGAPRTDSETRPLNVTGCWVIKLFGAVVNVGAADAAQLASDYANLAALIGAGPKFTKEYVSAAQSMTAGGLLNLTHGLGSVPKLITYEYVCVTAADGYSVGDIIDAGCSDYSSSANQTLGFFATKSTSILSIRVGSNGPPLLCNRSTGVGTTSASTIANFKLVVRAWA